jgi:TRAP-type C4-dicarboxylate transport system substrate-binding protein
MHELGLAPLTGATIVSKRTWDRLEPADREKLLAAAETVERRLKEEIPRQDEQAVEEMKARGLEVTTSADLPKWEEAARDFGASMRGGMVPIEIFDKAVELRDEYRQSFEEGGDS